MPPFPKPKFSYSWKKEDELREIQELQNQRRHGIPKPKSKQILVATWNIANLDTQKRTPGCLDLIAEILRPFDVTAIQEVNADLAGLLKIMKILGKDYSCVFTDVAGNEERLCYIYRKNKVQPTELIGELAIPPDRNWWLEFPAKNGNKIKKHFEGFHRTPYVIAWMFNSQKFSTYNCHIYYGDTELGNEEKFRKRILEVEALSKWVDNRIKKHREKLYSDSIILLGDMNIPRMEKIDPVYKQLTKRNMVGLDYHNHLEEGSNLKGDKYYDQLVFVTPFSKKIKLNRFGIFAWDRAVFHDLWDQTQTNPPKKTREQFRAYAKWAISDHRILWSLLDVKN